MSTLKNIKENKNRIAIINMVGGNDADRKRISGVLFMFNVKDIELG